MKLTEYKGNIIVDNVLFIFNADKILLEIKGKAEIIRFYLLFQMAYFVDQIII